MKSLVTLALLALAWVMGLESADAAMLATLTGRGTLKCGVAPNIPGFAYTDAQGQMRGWDVDLCRALAAATLGKADAATFTALSPRDGLVSLQTGVVDVLTHRFSDTFDRNTGPNGFDYPRLMYYDGQGFMVRKSAGAKSIADLDGASICVAQGTTTEKNIADYFRSHNLKVRIVTFADLDAARQAYDEGRCDAWSNDRSSLAARGLGLKNLADNMLLPDIISKEPTGPIVRKDDQPWEDIVRWTMNVLILAEEFGITSENVDQVRASSDNPEVRRILGVDGDSGQKLGLSKDWAYNAIKQVGNYGELFERNLGSGSPLKTARGVNNLWTKGGLLYSPALR